MLMGLQVGGGHPLGDVYMEEIRAHGIVLPRVEVQSPHPQNAPVRVPRDVAHEIVYEIARHEMVPYVLCRYPDQIEDLPDHPLHVELGNEPDLEKFGWTPESYNAAIFDAIPRLANRPFRLWVGVVSNLNERGFTFLRGIPWKDIPIEVGCSYHRYPHDTRGPEIGHIKPLFGSRKSRDWEVEQLRKIVGADRPLGVSEVGYHELDFPEEKAAEHFAWERAFFERTGHEFAIAYSMWDGPQEMEGYEAHFGFRNAEDGRWKKQTTSWTGVEV